jgi:hypothetical protein
MMNKVFLANIQQLFTEKVCLVLRVYLRCDVYILNFGYVYQYHLKCWIPCQPSTIHDKRCGWVILPCWNCAHAPRIGCCVPAWAHRTQKDECYTRGRAGDIDYFFLSICVYTVCISSCAVCFIKTYILHGGGGSINLMYGHPTTHSPSTTASNDAIVKTPF